MNSIQSVDVGAPIPARVDFGYQQALAISEYLTVVYGGREGIWHFAQRLSGAEPKPIPTGHWQIVCFTHDGQPGAELLAQIAAEVDTLALMVTAVMGAARSSWRRDAACHATLGHDENSRVHATALRLLVAAQIIEWNAGALGYMPGVNHYG